MHKPFHFSSISPPIASQTVWKVQFVAECITARRRPEQDLLYGPLVKEGLYFLVDVKIVLAPERGYTSLCLAGKEVGRGELMAEAFHGLQCVWGAAKEVSPERGEVFESSPIFKAARRGQRPKWAR
jgi:hypothetical protein